jgi:hypothetical protein
MLISGYVSPDVTNEISSTESWDAAAGLMIDRARTIKSPTAILAKANGTQGKLQVQRHDTHGDGQRIGMVEGYGRDSAGAELLYARLDFYASGDNAGNEFGDLFFNTVQAGELAQRAGIGAGLYVGAASVDRGAGIIDAETSVFTPMIVGGDAVGSTLVLRSTSNVGATDAIIFQVGEAGDTEAGRITTAGNWLIGGTTAPASATRALALFNGTAPSGSVTNGVVLFAEDVAASSELKVRDEAGNVSTLSPHNISAIPGGPSEAMAWAYYSERDGRSINVDMLRAVRLIEKLSGEQLVYEGNG